MRQKIKYQLFSIVFLFIVLASGIVVAHSEDEELKGNSWENPVFYIYIVSVLVVLLTIIVLVFQKRLTNNGKKIVFWLIVVSVVLATVYVAGHTIYKNVISESNGPVHWHADYQVWICGKKIDMIEPKFLSNKVGSALLHEHKDSRIHAEGVILSLKDVDLRSYFETIGGVLEGDTISYPSTEGVISYKNGDLCNSKPGSLKVYVNGKIVDNFEEYIMYPSFYVPPGDCIILEFDDSSAEKTDKLCESWEVKGWNYNNFERKEISIGGRTWS